MFYDTLYRHNQALAPTGLESVPSALHALNAAVDDCRRAGKSIAADASILLLIRSLADAAERAAPSVSELRRRCQLDRSTVEASPALLAIAGNSVGGDYPAKKDVSLSGAPRARPTRRGDRVQSKRCAHQHRHGPRR